MTRAYDDIEAVTRLLEEKEKDLELTVQIGKELLTQNNKLEHRINELEAELKESNEDRSQLVHELHNKNELINVLTSDSDNISETGEFPFRAIVLLHLFLIVLMLFCFCRIAHILQVGDLRFAAKENRQPAG